MAVIQDLPTEIALAMCQNLDMDDLRNLRLSGKALRECATEALFTHVVVLPTAESGRKCLNIRFNSKLRDLVKRVSFSTPPDPRTLKWGRDGEWHMPSEVESILFSLAGFGKLQHIDLKFWKQNDTYLRTLHIGSATAYGKTVNFRVRLLHRLLSAVEWKTKVTSITLENLKDDLTYVPVHDLHGSELELENKDLHSILRRVLFRLECFELRAAVDDIELDGSEHHFFNTTLPSNILGYATSTLRTLKLFSKFYWGYHPSFNFSALHFPCLKSLTLEKFTFAFDAQLSWILSHQDTLESLTLDDCPIIIGGRTPNGKHYRPAKAPPSSQLSQTQEGDLIWIYETRWHSYFKLLAEGLPHLRFFNFGEGDLYYERNFTDDYEFGLQLADTRYCVFDGQRSCHDETFCELSSYIGRKAVRYDIRGPRPGAWEQATRDIPPPACEREDAEALQDLIDAIAKRIGGHKLMITKAKEKPLRH